MGLTRQDVAWAATLARLQLDDAAIEKMTTQLSHVLDCFAKLNELDTTAIEPMSHPGAIRNVFRDDAPTGSLGRDDALKNAPDASDGFFRVPRVIE